jgi:ubiquinone/menaquinone biosynthesis C-methylase UbiE
MTGPDREAALAKYRREAGRYDRRTKRSRPYRERAIDLLRLRRGQTVLDVACGTGINFSLLEERIGRSGQIVGVDLSPEMLEQARGRCEHHGWTNVRLIESAIEELDIDATADAALFSLTHDVLQSDAALAAVARHLKPGARVASFGAKWPPRWNLPVRLGVWLVARSYVTTFSGFDRPWAKLERLAPDLTIESAALGGAYVAAGTLSQSDGL